MSLTTSSGFWRVTFGNILTIGAMMAGFLAFFLGYDHQIRDNTTAFITMSKERERESISRAAADLIVHDRLKAVENAQITLSPQLSRIDEKLNWIQDWIKDQKVNKRIAIP